MHARDISSTISKLTVRNKTITLYENTACLAMCPVVHFASLFFADNAFHPRLIEAGFTARRMHSFKCPDGRISIDFHFREDILDVPVFRRHRNTLQGIEVDPRRALSAKVSTMRPKGSDNGPASIKPLLPMPSGGKGQMR